MDKVVKFCQQPRLGLRCSPPFMLDILPDTYQHLRSICTRYEDSMDPKADKVLSHFVDNIAVKCRQALKLFKEGKLPIVVSIVVVVSASAQQSLTLYTVIILSTLSPSLSITMHLSSVVTSSTSPCASVCVCRQRENVRSGQHVPTEPDQADAGVLRTARRTEGTQRHASCRM